MKEPAQKHPAIVVFRQRYNLKLLRIPSTNAWTGAGVKIKSTVSITKLNWKNALWLDVPSHVTSFNQSGCTISAWHSYAILKIVKALTTGQFFAPEIMHSDWMFPITWLLLTNQGALFAKPQVSLMAQNCNDFKQVSLTVLDFFGCNCQS